MNSVNKQVASVIRRTHRLLPAACILASGLLLAACTNPVRDTAGQECVYVRVTGSNLPVKECRTAEERAALAARERDAAEQGLDNLQDLQEYGVEAPGAASLD